MLNESTECVEISAQMNQFYSMVSQWFAELFVEFEKGSSHKAYFFFFAPLYE